MGIGIATGKYEMCDPQGRGVPPPLPRPPPHQPPALQVVHPAVLAVHLRDVGGHLQDDLQGHQPDVPPVGQEVLQDPRSGGYALQELFELTAGTEIYRVMTNFPSYNRESLWYFKWASFYCIMHSS